MNYEKFTIKTQEALQEASSIAIKNDNSEISTEHVLLALLEQQEGLVTPIVECIGIPSLDLQKKIKDIILSNPKVSGTNQVYFSSEMQKILAKAEKEMASLHDEFLSTEHLLLSIAKSDGKVAYSKINQESSVKSETGFFCIPVLHILLLSIFHTLPYQLVFQF